MDLSHDRPFGQDSGPPDRGRQFTRQRGTFLGVRVVIRLGGQLPLPSQGNALAVTVLGPLEPVLRASALHSLNGRTEVLEIRSRGQRLVDETLALGARVLVANRSELVSLAGSLPPAVAAVGLSSASWDVIILCGSSVRHITNPSPESFAALIHLLHPDEVGK